MLVSRNYNNIHPSFKLNSVNYNFETLKELANQYILKGESYEKSIGEFLLEWTNDKDSVEVSTSGSTGTPKNITIKKQSMINSAIATGEYFHLEARERALLCLPASYIAGKMMLVRAMVLGLDLDSINPLSTPKIDSNERYQFGAMIPLQLKNTLNSIDKFDVVIVGGSPLSPNLKSQIEDGHCDLYETYGMTETVTHIAIKKVNNLSLFEIEYGAYFEVLPNVEIYQDHKDCLVIDAPRIADGIVLTNDIVKLHSKTEFEWLGRIDNVINTGGVKVFPEQIEKKLQKKINQRYFITSIDDDFLGEKVILVIESQAFEIGNITFEILEKFEIPKDIYFTKQFSQTDSGKIQRGNTLELILKEQKNDEN